MTEAKLRIFIVIMNDINKNVQIYCSLQHTLFFIIQSDQLLEIHTFIHMATHFS